jgi:ArsR family transcriptional regulator, arsenate/arsenite/antimonite-responsive transcriptional repressor
MTKLHSADGIRQRLIPARGELSFSVVEDRRPHSYHQPMAPGDSQPLPLAQPRVVADPRNLTLEAFSALAHPLRLQLIAHIAASGPLCSCHLEEVAGQSQPQISKHLRVLRRAGLVQRRREGRWVYYSLDAEALENARGFLEDLQASMRVPHLADHCDG